MAQGSLKFKITADSSDFKKKLDQISKDSVNAEKKIGANIAKVGKIAAAAGAAVYTAVSTAVSFIGKASIEAYADQEQLIGGVEKLYGDAAGVVVANAKQAYRTVGVSANQYMQQATSFSASLVSSNPSNGAQVNPEQSTITLLFSNNVAGNEAWENNQHCFMLTDENGVTYPCTVSRQYFGNTPGDTADPNNNRRTLFISFSNLQPGRFYTLTGTGLITQGNVSIPSFSITFSTSGKPTDSDSGADGGGGEVDNSGEGSGDSGQGNNSDSNDTTPNSGTHHLEDELNEDAEVLEQSPQDSNVTAVYNSVQPTVPIVQDSAAQITSTQEADSATNSEEGTSSHKNLYSVGSFNASQANVPQAESLAIYATSFSLYIVLALIVAGFVTRYITWKRKGY